MPTLLNNGEATAWPGRNGEATTWPQRAAGVDRIGRLAGALMFMTMLYMQIGLPEADKHVLHPTDYVDPLNRWIWLGTFTLALPILVARGAMVGRLLAASWPLLVLDLWFALSRVWALDPDVSSRRLAETLVQFVLLLVLVCGIADHRRLHRLICLACMVTLAVDLATALAAPGYAFDPDGFSGVHPQKNFAGEIMLYCGLASGSFALLPGQRPARWRWALLIAVIFGLLLLSRSATSLGAALGTPVATVLLARATRLRGTALLAIAAVLLLVLAAGLFAYLVWCGATAADPLLPLRHVTFSARRDLWQFMWDEIRQRPLTGYGFASFWAIDEAVQPSLKLGAWFGSDGTIINEGHDGYLDLLVTTGAIGLLLGLMVVGRTFGLAWRVLGHALRAPQRAAMPAATAGFHMVFLLAFLVHNVTESDLFAVGLPFGLAFLVCMLDLQLGVIQADALRAAQPDALRATQPDAPRAAQPDALRATQPDAPRATQPDAPRAMQTDAGGAIPADAAARRWPA
jgi:O-antigen ligase